MCCCNEDINSDKVFYSGEFLPETQISPNEDLTSVIIDINNTIKNIVAPISKYQTGVVTFTPNGLQTQFTIPNPRATNTINGMVVPGNVNTNNNFYMDIVSDDITINYSIAPTQGLDIKFYFTFYY